MDATSDDEWADDEPFEIEFRDLTISVPGWMAGFTASLIHGMASFDPSWLPVMMEKVSAALDSEYESVKANPAAMSEAFKRDMLCWFLGQQQPEWPPVNLSN